MPVGRFCNLVYFWATSGADQAETAKFDMHLYRPPPGQKATKGPWSPEAETAAFQGLKTALKK